MDAYEDTIEAFDRLIEWLSEHPDHIPFTLNGESVRALRHHGDYGSELIKRSDRVASQLNHLIKDGLQIPEDYVWRRFREAVENGCRFSHGYGCYDEEAQVELRRVMRAAKTSLEELHHQKRPPTKLKPAPLAPETPDQSASVKVSTGFKWWYVLVPFVPLSKKGWFWKAIFSGSVAFAWFYVVLNGLGHLAFDETRKIVPSLNLAIYAIAITPLPTVFNATLTLLNTIFK